MFHFLIILAFLSPTKLYVDFKNLPSIHARHAFSGSGGNARPLKFNGANKIKFNYS